MKSFILLVGLAVISFSVAEEYTDRYDDINIDEILQNKRLLASYMKCVLGQGRCTPEGKEIRVNLQDGMQTGCSKCTKTQKIKARKVVNHLRNHEHQFWEDLKKKFDPENKFKPTYEAFLDSED
ncbi:allergen Tha p 1-like [Maniola hyperantus]|uniref:allergen Tha p 1-like n=1 Tax=Aphantopus hyperantus TaxID=2795564 RepID=UPI001568A8C0|nr:allergen Tha p 1-like [Maniola hyperantus]